MGFDSHYLGEKRTLNKKVDRETKDGKLVKKVF